MTNKYILTDFENIDRHVYAPGVSSSQGAKKIGERISFGLATKAKGTGSRMHKHATEQFNYLLKGKLKVVIEGEDERIVGPGELVYVPANTYHQFITVSDEDVEFIGIKDVSKDLQTETQDGTYDKPHYEPGYEPAAKK
ncbi:MAG: cupin domain-containing protein [Rhodospirillales bacterium]